MNIYLYMVRALVNMVMNIDSIKGGKFLDSAINSFFGRNLLQG